MNETKSEIGFCFVCKLEHCYRKPVSLGSSAADYLLTWHRIVASFGVCIVVIILYFRKCSDGRGWRGGAKLTDCIKGATMIRFAEL